MFVLYPRFDRSVVINSLIKKSADRERASLTMNLNNTFSYEIKNDSNKRRPFYIHVLYKSVIYITIVHEICEHSFTFLDCY